MKEVSIKIIRNLSWDWAGVYVDDILEMEGHAISDNDWIQLIESHRYFKSIVSYEVTDEYMEETGLPRNFNDVEESELEGSR